MEPDNALVLVVEDEADIAEIITAYLEREGFRWVHANDGATAIELHRALKPDIVLLDVGLPRSDGWEVLSELRRRGSTPVIMVTALDKDIDKLQALRIGADDYVVKPFNPVEVVARVRAVLRRSAGHSSRGILRVGALQLDPESHLASVVTDGELVHLNLTLTEYRLLVHMAAASMRVFSRGELVDACLPGGDALDRTVDSHVSKLRRKLADAGIDDMPSGVRGVGYRLVAIR
ncbi:response regulator [soil metagenome]